MNIPILAFAFAVTLLAGIYIGWAFCSDDKKQNKDRIENETQNNN